ncbi:MAG: flagellar hook-associated family protein [Rhodomicrobium sp.]|nr:flagellar hook-associated family protein [Rhodomicrobium sp.]
MDIAYTSTKSLSEGSRLSILKLQSRLIKAQQELSSGRLADVGATLGGRTSETVSLRQQFARLTTLTETNAVVRTRLDISQTTITSVISSAENFVKTLIGARDAEGGAGVSQSEAQADLVAFIDGLNTTVGGEFLFAGINSSTKPLANYFATPTSPGKAAVDAAFTTAFGTTQSDPANIAISSSAMQTFLDTAFSSLFDDPAWSVNWSSASATNVTSRISSFEEVQSSANASEAAFRKLAKAFTMIADLGVENMNKATFGVVADTASRLASEAIQGLTTIQARLGTASARVEAANIKMSLQLDIINTQIDTLEKVDPFEASATVTTLLTQLEISYSLTARVQRQTILNFL